jgi:hypothetical protein
MTNEVLDNRIGYRYLFDSKGCSISKRDEATINLIVSEKYDLQIYFGPKPKHGIQTVSGYSKYYVPGTKTPLGKYEFKQDVDSSSNYGPFFLEIVISKEVDVSVPNNSTIHNDLLTHAERTKEEFKSILNLVAGIIGLRVHRQFVFELINENALAWKEKKPFIGYAGPALEILETLPLNNNGITMLENIGKNLKNLAIEDVKKYGLIFHWLLRAWHERDFYYSFITLFIPLECVLGITSDLKMNSTDKGRAKTLRMLIKKHAGEQSEELRYFLDCLIQNVRPTLQERFIDFAKTAKMPGWETDIEAFQKFNRMRNILLHGADKEVHQKLTVGEKEVRTLSDLVERYINYFLFKDNNVYQSRWRPKIGAITI